MRTVDLFPFDSPLVLGIDIRDRIVRVIQANGKPEVPKVTKVDEFELPSDLVKDGVIVCPRQMAAFLRDQLVVENYTASRCSFSVPSSHAIIAELALPKMSAAELPEAVRFRLKKSLPFLVEDAYIETVQLREPADDSCMDILAIAIPKAVVDSRADMLAYAGLEPISAETDSQSILRVIHRRAARLDSLARDSSLTVVEIGESATAMYVIRQRRLQFHRTVKFGIQDLFAKICQAGRDEADARAILSQPSTYLRSGGMLEFEHNGLAKACSISEELGRLMKEVGRLLRYFKSLHPERSFEGLLDTMLVCGEFAACPGFLDYFTAELRCRSELLRPLSEVNVGVHARARDSISRNEAKYAVATGCLLLGIEVGEQTGGQELGRRNRPLQRAQA